jgi:hypothetical protein
VEETLAELKRKHPESKVEIICGFSKSKDIKEILVLMAKKEDFVENIYPVSGTHFRLASIETIK